MSKIKDPNRWESFACENAEFYIVTDPEVDYESAEGQEQFYRSGETLTHQTLDRVRSKLPAWDMAIEIKPFIKPGFPGWLLPIADKRSTKAVSDRVRPYTGTIDHDLPFYWADSLMGNPASGHVVR